MLHPIGELACDGLCLVSDRGPYPLLANVVPESRSTAAPLDGTPSRGPSEVGGVPQRLRARGHRDGSGAEHAVLPTVVNIVLRILRHTEQGVPLAQDKVCRAGSSDRV